MGAICGCDNFVAADNTPNVLQPLNRGKQIIKPRRAFQDIVPVKDSSEDPTKRQLIQLTKQIQDCVWRFQDINGKLSKRFDHQIIDTERIRIDFDCLVSNFQNTQSEKENQLCVFQRNKQEIKSIKLNQKLILNQNVKGQMNCLQEKQPFQTNSNLKQIPTFEQSFNSQTQSEKSSCKLLNPNKLLNSSIFTLGQIAQQQFYCDYNCINKISLLKWKEKQIIANLLTIQKCQQIKSSCTAITALYSISLFQQKHGKNLIISSSLGIRVYANGIQRLYETRQVSPQTLIRAIQSLRNKQITLQISLDLYLLSGWLPQVILMKDVKSFNSLMERLVTNLQEGSLMLSFSKNQSQDALILIEVDIQSKTILGYASVSQQLNKLSQRVQNNRYVLKWSIVSLLYQQININWNPQIYDMHFHFSGKSQDCFHLAVYENEQDTEVRFLIQRHRQDRAVSPFILSIYQYHEYTVDYRCSKPVKIITGQQSLYSSIAVFQASQQLTQYVLRLQSDDPSAHFTLNIYSFAQIDAIPFIPKRILKSVQLTSQVDPTHKGSSINSPYFANNIQYSVIAPKGFFLHIGVNLPEEYQYQISLISNSTGSQYITRVPLTSIMNDLTVSDLRKGQSQILIPTNASQHLLIINSYTSCKCTAKINIDLLGEEPTEAQLSIRELKWKQDCVYRKDIKWSPCNSGPRKRLRSNTVSEYQPIAVFQEFLLNPYEDKLIEKGCYQFHVQSMSYKEQYDMSGEEQILCDPPALSLAILKISKDKKSLKIIIDDAFYVPFGFGFWSQPLQLNQGIYKFVFPKMEQGFSKGIFQIIKC